MKYLTSKKQNIVVTIVLSIICFALLHSSGSLDNAGMAAIFLNWLPIIIGLMTIVVYFIASVISDKYAWIVTVVGNVFNLIIVLRAFWDVQSNT